MNGRLPAAAVAAVVDVATIRPEGDAMNCSGGIALNEDDSHYYGTRAGEQPDVERVASWVDQYANTQIKELMLNPNAQRTTYGSEVWDPVWKGYDPGKDGNQPMFESANRRDPGNGERERKWIHFAWQLHQAGIDVYRTWIDRCRKVGISPWISMRMNDMHDAPDEDSFMHSTFWRENPQMRLASYKFTQWADRSLDYGRPEVREYSMKLVRELAGRYDFDGLELDWMRFGFHFRPGYEWEGIPVLTEFTAEVRRLLDEQERKRGHPIRLGARVPAHPQTALGLGMDAATWARLKLIDTLIVAPFFPSIDNGIPVELWKRLLEGTEARLFVGFEDLIRPYPDHKPFTLHNSLETVRGSAASALNRGADRVYLFNYMDNCPSAGESGDYATLLREIGSLDTIKGKSRRHILTYQDTWAPGEPKAAILPAVCASNDWQAFRVHIGPEPDSGETTTAALGIVAGGEHVGSMDVRANGELCIPLGRINLPSPGTSLPVYGYSVPRSAVKRGYNLIEVGPQGPVTIGWVELAIRP